MARGRKSPGPFAIHDPCTGRHAVEVQRAVRSLAAGLGADRARAQRRGADHLLRLRRPCVLRQSRGYGQDRRPAHRRERGRLSDLLRDVPGQFRPPRQALGAFAGPGFSRTRRRRSGRAARSWLLPAPGQPGPAQGANAARIMGREHERSRSRNRSDRARGRARGHGAQADPCRGRGARHRRRPRRPAAS